MGELIEIKIFLLRNGLDQTRVAKALGVTKQYVHDIFHGRRKALQIRHRLVQELGFPPELIAYRPNGRRAA